MSDAQWFSMQNNKWTATQNHTRFIKNNVQNQTEADCRRELEYVKRAMLDGMFNTQTNEIEILRVHLGQQTGDKTDSAHFTVLVKPGSYIVRLYSELPEITESAKCAYAIPPKFNPHTCNFWVYSATCAETTLNYDTHTTGNTNISHNHFLPGYSVFIGSNLLWDNGKKITYSFIDKTKSTAIQRKKVAEVIAEWQKWANITFEEVTKEEQQSILRISFDRMQGSWSFTGTENLAVKSDKPTMNLGWVFGNSPSVSPEERGVILHEFGHAIGLMHEHQSPAQEGEIRLDEDAVIEYYTNAQHRSAEEVKEQVIRIYNESQINNHSKYNANSIMMYFMPAEMNVEHKTIPPINKLSDLDKAFIAIVYPPTNREQFVEALNTAKIPLPTKTDILTAYTAGDWSQVRTLFTAFCREAHGAAKGPVDVNHTVDSDHPIQATNSDTADKLLDFRCLAEEISTISPKGVQRGVSYANHWLWLPGQVITFCFLQDLSEATLYRKQRVRETFQFYAERANLMFKQIAYCPNSPAMIRISFTPIPDRTVAAWSKLGRESIGYTQNADDIMTRGGLVDSSMNFSDVVPKNPPPTSTDKSLTFAQKREMRALYHEIGHALGLMHEHTSPNAVWAIRNYQKDSDAWVATAFDEDSVMLYSGRNLNWSSDGKICDKTKYNHEPSPLDLAFLGAIYPYPEGDGGRFLADLGELGITNTMLYEKLREMVFSASNKSFSQMYIYKLREQLHKDMYQPPPGDEPAHGMPTHSIQRGVMNPNSTATSGSFLGELIKQLSLFFRPTSGQIFALQFPGRFLQKDLYAWDTTKAGIYGQFVKPTVVNESEFRLVDQLYNVGTVIGAPSGLNLSIVYEQVLNNLVPGIQPSQINFSKQQGEIRQWLLKDVPTSGWVKELIASQQMQSTSGQTSNTGAGGIGAARSINPSASSLPPDLAAKPQFSVANKLTGKESKVNRLELAAALMQEYLSAKQAWELERDEMKKKASGQAELDALSRRLAHITPIREEQLAAKYGDAVVRGYSHAIRQYLGYMDIKTPAEALQDAKDALRESAVSSMDGSMKVYPVQLQPIDWFQSLSTSFTMEDLTANPDLIMQQIDNKSKQLDTLNSRLAVLQSKPKVNIQDIQKKLDSAQEAYDRANVDLTSTYSTNVLSLAKTCINSNNVFVMSDFETSAGAAKIATTAFAKIEDGMKSLNDASLAVKQQSRALTQLMAAKSLAESTDVAQEITETTLLITALTKDISELTARVQALRYKDGAISAVPSPDTSTPTTSILKDIPLLKPDSGSGGSRWQDFSFSHEIDTKYSSSSNISTASNSNTSVPLFFGSYQSDSHSASASSNETSQSKSITVEVGFRATLVTVDRGGWFQPQFFKQSAGFHSINPNITWSKWPESVKTVQDLSGIGSMNPSDAEEACNELNKHLLPAFPTGFVICKDITIKIHLSLEEIEKQRNEMESHATNSAGVLCFSTNSSGSSKESDQAYGFQAVADGCVIRIPGPQILGYIMQFTDPDTTTVIPETLPEGFLISDTEYDSTFAGDEK